MISTDVDTGLREVVLTVSNSPPGLNRIVNLHWASFNEKKKKWIREMDVALARQAKGLDDLKLPVEVSFRRGFWRGSGLDLDNLAASLKFPIDGLVENGLLPDDDPSCISSIDVENVRVDKQEFPWSQIIIREV